MIPTLVSIFLDYQCNFSCAHCSVGSSPQTKLKMSDKIFDKLFKDLEQVKSIRLAVFTGGEATIHPEMLQEGIRRSKALGLKTRLVSNAWWAKTPEKAHTYLKKLQDCGLDEINTSYDDFHEPFLKLEKVGHLIRAAGEINMGVGMGVINDKNAKYNTDTIKAQLASQLGISVKELCRQVPIVDDYPTPSGTGEELDVKGLDAGGKLDIGCPEIMKTVAIHPNGSIKACCGHGQLYQQDLAVGNILHEDLEDIIVRGTENIFYWWIHYVGPKRILERLGVKQQYASICHACTDLLSNHREALVVYLEDNKDAIFQQEILMSDNLANMANWVVDQEEIIMRHLENMGEDRV